MSGKYLLDTNLVIALLADEPAVRERVASADEVLVSVIAVGELRFGALKSGRVAQNLSRLDEFAKAITVLGCDLGTTRRYGEIKNALRLKGRPIPENDIWMAALAVQHGLTLVSRDSHFREIDGLDVEAW